MQDYKLIFRQTAEGPIETVVVVSNSAAGALAMAHEHQWEAAELWRNDEFLCRMTYSSAGFWIIHAQGAADQVQVRQPGKSI